MKSLLKMLAMSMLFVFVMASCAKAPDAEVAQVKNLIEVAKSVEADRYVPVEFNALNDSLNVATAAIEAQNSKFVLFRNYKDAKTTLTSTITLAETVKTNAVTKKEEVKLQSQQLLAETNTLVIEVKDLITKAPKGKEGRAALEMISSDVTVIEASLTEVSTLINQGDYLTALDKVKSANEKTISLKNELETAIAKTR
jgi:hypothetical protein